MNGNDEYESTFHGSDFKNSPTVAQEAMQTRHYQRVNDTTVSPTNHFLRSTKVTVANNRCIRTPAELSPQKASLFLMKGGMERATRSKNQTN